MRTLGRRQGGPVGWGGSPQKTRHTDSGPGCQALNLVGDHKGKRSTPLTPVSPTPDEFPPCEWPLSATVCPCVPPDSPSKPLRRTFSVRVSSTSHGRATTSVSSSMSGPQEAVCFHTTRPHPSFRDDSRTVEPGHGPTARTPEGAQVGSTAGGTRIQRRDLSVHKLKDPMVTRG